MPSTQQVFEFVRQLSPDEALGLLRASSHMQGLGVETLTSADVAGLLEQLQVQLTRHARSKVRPPPSSTAKWLVLALVGLAAAAWIDGNRRPPRL